MYNEDTTGDGTGQQAPQDDQAAQQEAENKYRSLDSKGTGQLQSAQTSTTKHTPHTPNMSERKGIEARNPVLRSLHDILREELKQQELAQMNQNVASIQQQYAESQMGVEVLASAQGGSYEKLQEINNEQVDMEEVIDDLEKEEEKGEEYKEMIASQQKSITEQKIAQENSALDNISDTNMTWKQMLSQTDLLASNLCEQLRLILVPTVAARLKGDYKSGKRLNIRKILPFIASGYRRDKIWLRRAKLSNRNYRVALALDNSQSMRTGGAGEMALTAASIIYGALSKLETGDSFSMFSFGQTAASIKLENDTPLRQVFDFTESQTNLSDALEQISTLADTSTQLLAIYISDGVCPNHEHLRHQLARQRALGVVSLFIVIDCAPGKQSITELTSVDRHPQTGQLMFRKYLQDFPFDFYIVVQDIQQLPSLVSEALRQWFRSISQQP